MENVKEIKKEFRPFKLVFNPGIARRLLHMGIPIVDIKQDRSNSDKTVFAFKNDANFREAFETINKEIAESKEQNTEQVL